MDRNIVVKPEIAKQFKNAMDSGQVVLLSAPCGMGKPLWRGLCLQDAGFWKYRQEAPILKYRRLTEAGKSSL